MKLKYVVLAFVVLMVNRGNIISGLCSAVNIQWIARVKKINEYLFKKS